MRLALVFALAALAGCANPAQDGEIVGLGSGSDDAAECQTASDCALASARCCDCPTFATPVDAGGADLCEGVTCPSPGLVCPANLKASCVESKCVLACDVVACDTSCADGFAFDANGCLACTCFQVKERSCTTGSDCAETPADCCGCALGGTDTAVPASQVASYQASLDCPSSPDCPGVSTCQADLGPVCVQGACALQPALPAGACGRPDLPACPTGTVCSLNADPYASAQGVGVCEPST